MKLSTIKIFFIFCILLLEGCLPKSQFDELHSPLYKLPWEVNYSASLGSNSITLTWASVNNALSYTVKFKDEADIDFTTSEKATSPFVISGLTQGHTYVAKIIAIGSTGSTESATSTLFLGNPPFANDIVTPNIQAGTTETITLDYVDANSDLANSCSVSSPVGLSFSSSCTCSAGICSVDVTGSTATLGSAQFNYSVTAGGQTSNTAHVTLNYVCPIDFISIPPDALLGASAFCIMKYEAKNISGIATSSPVTSPWTSLTIASAKSQCQALGTKYDLTSNLEWMSIARNIEGVSINWSGASVGNGSLNAGHSNSSSGLLAISDTNNPYSDEIGTFWSQNRVHTLSNGNTIWDFAGNADEWVDWSLASGLQSVTPTQKAYNSLDGNPLNTAIELNLLDSNIGSTDEMFIGTWQPSHPTYSSTEGIGQYLAGDNVSGGYARRGGFHSSGSASGIYGLDLTANSSSFYSQTGFRCVYRP